VAGHVHYPDEDVVAEAVVSEAQLDGDAPLLLLLEPVAVDPGQGLDERRLAVVDVTGRTDHHLFHSDMILYG
jgi:hypothetical protein